MVNNKANSTTPDLCFQIQELKEEIARLKSQSKPKPFLSIGSKTKKKRVEKVFEVLKSEFASASTESPLSDQGISNQN
jgi:hypothetical protein